MQLKALLLDLDGTLVDTAPDMVGTLNRLLEKHRHPPVEREAAGRMVSDGTRALVKFGFGDSRSEHQTESLVAEFLDDYARNICVDSQLYSGMQAVLDLCAAQGLRWGVVTNKPLALSRAVLGELGVLEQCAVLMGGDSLPVKKPDPAPLLHCCMVLNLAASECLYVGDHKRDISAGKSAGMDTAAALWGYIHEDDDPAQWQANYLIKHPDGLLRLVAEKTS